MLDMTRKELYVIPDETYKDPVIEAYKKDIDDTLLDENSKLTVEQRFDNLMQLQDFAEELRGAMSRATAGK
jgi:hypothetical protein